MGWRQPSFDRHHHKFDVGDGGVAEWVSKECFESITPRCIVTKINLGAMLAVTSIMT